MNILVYARPNLVYCPIDLLQSTGDSAHLVALMVRMTPAYLAVKYSYSEVIHWRKRAEVYALGFLLMR